MSATALRHQAKPFDVALINTDRRERIQLTPFAGAELFERFLARTRHVPAVADAPFGDDAGCSGRTQGGVIMRKGNFDQG